MTEAVVDGGVNAPAEPHVVIDANPASRNEPLPNQARVEAKSDEIEQKPVSNADALKQASDKVKAKTAEKAEVKSEEKPEAKPEAKSEVKPEQEKAQQPRADNGKFASPDPKEQKAETQHRDPPRRFDDAAKAEWDKAPESIKAATHRAIKELEDGFGKYRDDAKEYETVRYFGERAKQGGTTLKDALTAYVGMEDLLRQNPVRGMLEICKNAGLNPADIAAELFNASTGQAPQQQAQQPQIDPQRLEYEITQKVTQQFEAKQTAEKVSQFAAEHPRFDELSGDIAMFLSSGKIPEYLPPDQRLAEAYAMAERLNPAPNANPAIPKLIPSEIENAAQTAAKPLKPAGTKSIHGAPANGSDPEARSEPSKSNADALRKAARRLRA